eukprot:2760716-Pleurochrysis_carterae.AAC.2
MVTMMIISTPTSRHTHMRAPTACRDHTEQPKKSRKAASGTLLLCERLYRFGVAERAATAFERVHAPFDAWSFCLRPRSS